MTKKTPMEYGAVFRFTEPNNPDVEVRVTVLQLLECARLAAERGVIRPLPTSWTSNEIPRHK